MRALLATLALNVWGVKINELFSPPPFFLWSPMMGVVVSPDVSELSGDQDEPLALPELLPWEAPAQWKEPAAATPCSPESRWGC